MLATTRVTPRSVGGLMTLSINAVRLTRAQAAAKRTFDLVVSSIALLLVSPVLLAVAVAIKLEGGGPVLFRQARVGMHRQPFNVLKGEMSLVGPRPPLPTEVARYEDWQLDRLEVRPGITGLWQVSGRSELSFDEYVRLDLFYIENWSMLYDLFVVAKTVPILLLPRGAY